MLDQVPADTWRAHARGAHVHEDSISYWMGMVSWRIIRHICCQVQVAVVKDLARFLNHDELLRVLIVIMYQGQQDPDPSASRGTDLRMPSKVN